MAWLRELIKGKSATSLNAGEHVTSSRGGYSSDTICFVCHNFRKRSFRYGDQERFAADFAPQSINASAITCRYCAIIHKAIRQFELSEEDGLEQQIARIYARRPAELPPRTLSLDVYFKGPRPKLEVEIYHHSLGRLPSSLLIIRIL
jgi:hypothetical protein